MGPNPDDDLDTEISSIRAEIRNLQNHKRYFTSSLLASDSLQKHLSNLGAHKSPSSSLPLAEETSPLLQTATTHTDSNHHRIAFSTTTFPFRDPDPVLSSRNNDEKGLLGLRIDVCARNGRFSRPYYVLLKKVSDPGADAHGSKGKKGRWLRVHRHTIPAFLSMDKLQRVYLPVPVPVPERGDTEENDEEMQLKPWKKPKHQPKQQNLHAFARALRRELVSWHLRHGAIAHLREKLGVQNTSSQDTTTTAISEDKLNGDGNGGWLPINPLGLVSLSPASLEARYVRLEWEDGRVGRFKLSNSGIVERAVVIGDSGRDKVVEGVLRGGDGRVEGVLERLARLTAATNSDPAEDA